VKIFELKFDPRTFGMVNILLPIRLILSVVLIEVTGEKSVGVPLKFRANCE
jgi:hypothetical protein